MIGLNNLKLANAQIGIQYASPHAIGGATGRVLLVTDDPDAMVQRAVEAGAAEKSPPHDEHGWRLGRIVDPFGHEWEIGKPIRPWPPDLTPLTDAAPQK